MKFIPVLLAAASLASQEAAVPKPVVNPGAADPSSKSTLLIDAKARAGDYVQAFEMLRKDKPTLKIMIHMASGLSISNVTEISSTANGTLVLIKSASTTGNKYQIVPIEEIKELAYSPS